MKLYNHKDCMNCKFEIGECKSRELDKRQLRKLNRTVDKWGIWNRYYCKNHKLIKTPYATL